MWSYLPPVPWFWVSPDGGPQRARVLSCRGGQGPEGGPHGPPEVLYVFPQGGAVEAPKDKVMIRVLHGVPDGHVPEETTFCPQNYIFVEQVHVGPHAKLGSLLDPWVPPHRHPEGT